MLVPTVSDISNWQDRVVFVRSGLNLPMTPEGEIADEYRLDRVLPTIHHLSQAGAKVIIIAHQGRGEDESLHKVYRALKESIDADFMPEFFARPINESMSDLQAWVDKARAGAVVLLDNVRASAGEQANDQDLAAALAAVGEVYVNEAFSASHRSHMSLDALPRLMDQAVAGFNCSEELEALELALDPPRGSVAVIGGNKIQTKLPLLQSLLDSYETVFVGGALANTFYHLQGYELGRSVYESDLDEETGALVHSILENPRIYLPKTLVCESADGSVRTTSIDDVSPTEAVYDVAEQEIVDLIQQHKHTPLVVWNGPLGYLEGGHTLGTRTLADLVRVLPAESIVGGGNTVDAVREYELDEGIDFLSTGGGAMIQYLTHQTLPALEALHL